MSKRTSTPAAPLYEWRIIRLKKSPAALVGYVNAPDQEGAIRKAIESFDIRNPQQQSRLSAVKVRRSPP
jgi:1,2-phenylacetyl-CoA epoxidase PaaB subunit